MYGDKVRNFLCDRDAPIVNTRAGSVRGYMVSDIYQFRGVPYARAERFQEPQPTETWEDARDTLEYGYVCPLLNEPFLMGDFNCPHHYWPSNEQCLNLNIWTPELGDEAKKPVMFWIHGGGYSDGSSIEQFAYDGENLARNGDLVVVSVNHRLNVLGYCDLSEFGEKYSASGINGMLDIVAALRWVKENIAAFGGDPGNVTIFGQSGGGGKIVTLMQMPETDGLYARAIIQSGVIPRLHVSQKDARERSRVLVNAAGGIDRLCEMPHSKLAELVKTCGADFSVWAPVADGKRYIGDCFDVGFRAETADIPVIVGTTLAEFSFGVSPKGNHNYTAEEKLELLRKKYGEGAEAVLKAFEDAYPEIDDYYALQADTLFRVPTVRYAELRSKFTNAGTYNYLFTFEADFKGGFMAPHCSELPFIFCNAENMPNCWCEGVTERLQKEMSGAWISFAKTGKPSTSAAESWPTYNADNRPVMIFGNVSGLKYNHDTELISLAEKYAVPMSMTPPVHH